MTTTPLSCLRPTHSPDRPQPEAQFARNDAGFVTTSRLSDGRVLCAIGGEYCWPCELSTDDTGTLVDVCQPCAAREAAAVALAVVLNRIVEADTDYAARYPMVFEAVHLALSAGFPAGVAIDRAEPEWPVVYIELPDGQVSWHMPAHAREWDQHTTPEKFARIARYVAREIRT